jgi:hypothetical protein
MLDRRTGRGTRRLFDPFAECRPKPQQASQERAKRQHVLIFEPGMPAGTKLITENLLPPKFTNIKLFADSESRNGHLF